MRKTLHAHTSRAQNVLSPSLSSTLALFSLPRVATGSSRPYLARFPYTQRIRYVNHRSVSTKASSAIHELAEVSKGPNPLVFRSSSTNPYHNLCIEDYLLRNSDHSSRILFFYTNRPCVVIGRNQNPWLECNLQRLREGLPDGDADNAKDRAGLQARNQVIPIDLVRRRSGGGTVFHDLGNLNYSVIVPNDKDFNRRKHAEMVVRGLSKMTSHDFDANVKVNERHDIVMQKHGSEEWLKISGSAFKLTKGRALHHGTLLYSSPHLHHISGLLRSLGRGHIHAKGVESVRSKVGNLSWIESRAERGKLETAIIDSVMAEFLNLYGDGCAVQSQPVNVSDECCAEEMNPTIATGVRELKNNDWYFGQTPRFDFDSGMLNGSQIQFQANRGVIETVKITRAGSEGTYEAEGKPSSPAHVHDISDWKSTIRGLQSVRQREDQDHSTSEDVFRQATQNPALMKQLETIFPHFPK